VLGSTHIVRVCATLCHLYLHYSLCHATLRDAAVVHSSQLYVKYVVVSCTDT